jgi:hypothetical protein
MLLPKIRLGLGIGSILGFQLLADPANPAAPPMATPPALASLNASVQAGEIVGFEQFHRVFMNVGGRRLMFVVPQEDFRADIADPEKVVLVSQDYTCLLSFRIATNGSDIGTPLNAELCRTWLSARLGEPTFLDEFSQTAASCSGPAFDLIAQTNGVTRYCRVAFVASPIGILEFTVSASPEKFSAAKSTFQAWLRGFQISDAQGQLKISPAVQGGS